MKAALFLLLLPAAAQAQEEAPFGPPGFGLTLGPPAWRGLRVSTGFFSGSGLETDAGRSVATRSNGVDPVLRQTVELDEKDVDAPVLAVTVDLDLFRLSSRFFFGDFEGEGTITTVEGVDPPVVSAVDLEGDFYGFRIGAFWPALRWRDARFEAAIGPAASVGWFHEEIDSVPGAPIPTRDSVDELIGTLGPRLSLRTAFGRLSFSLEAEAAVIGGGSEGAVYELTAGVGYSF